MLPDCVEKAFQPPITYIIISAPDMSNVLAADRQKMFRS